MEPERLSQVDLNEQTVDKNIITSEQTVDRDPNIPCTSVHAAQVQAQVQDNEDRNLTILNTPSILSSDSLVPISSILYAPKVCCILKLLHTRLSSFAVYIITI